MGKIKNIVNNNIFKYILTVIIVLLMFVLSVWVTGGKINNYIDIPTLLFVGILPYCIMWVSFGDSKTKKIISAPFTKNIDDGILNESLLFFKMLNKMIWCSTLFVMIINVINMLLTYGGITSSGLDYKILFILTLISPLYALLINLIFIIPYTVFIKRKLNNFGLKE